MARAQRPFTSKFLDSLKAEPGQRVDRWDPAAPGLGIRVSGPRKNAKGGACTKRWVLMTRDPEGGNARRIVIGTYPALSLSEARLRAAELKDKRLAGCDVASVLEQERAAVKAAHVEAAKEPTVRDFAAVYLKRHAAKKASASEDERMLDKDVLPAIGDLKIRDVRRRHLIDIIDSVNDRGAPVTANRVVSLLSKFFFFAMDRGVIDSTPAQRLPKNSEQPKERALDDEEIRTFWSGIEKTNASDGVKAALKLVLLLGQRPGEVVGMRESELDGDTWTIPVARIKTRRKVRRDHKVPLGPLALELIQRAREAAHGSDCLFPSPRRKPGEPDRPIDEKSLSRVIRRNLPGGEATRPVRGGEPRPAALDMAHFEPHSLRRTTRTRLAALGISRETARAVLNHAQEGMDAVYDVHDYLPEKRDALLKWERRLRELVGLPLLEAEVRSIRAAR